MDRKDVQARINKAVDVMLGLDANASAAPKSGWAIDISKPNIHDNKPDFIRERDAVAAMEANVGSLLDFITAGAFEDDESGDAMSRRVMLDIDDWAKENRPQDRPSYIGEMLANNASDYGLSVSLAFILARYHIGLTRRRMELKDQEQEFWSGGSRPPNHYARTIALRLARLYSQEIGEFPTVGVSGDGGYPSTAYTRALQEIFEVLKIKANVRNAAKWAVRQLNETDKTKYVNALAALYPRQNSEDLFVETLIEAMRK